MSLQTGNNPPANSLFVLDSVPYKASLHRESQLRAESIANGGLNSFPFAQVHISQKTEFVVMLSQSDPRPGE